MTANVFRNFTKGLVHCHLALVLERLFRYVFQENFEVTENKIVETHKK